MDTHEYNLEFAASQAADGTLDEATRFALGDELATDAGRRHIAAHEQMTDLLRRHDPLPAIDFDAFAATVSGALEAEDAYAPAPLAMRPVWVRRLAVAAAVTLAVLAAWPFLPHKSASHTAPAGVGEVSVQISSVSPPTTGPAVAVQVGPSEEMVQRGLAAGIDTEGKPLGQPKVVITAVETSNDLRPY